MHRATRLVLFTTLLTAILLFWNQESAAQDPPIPADTELVRTSTGLAYSVLKKGTGSVDHPALGDRVVVHYTGWLTDGKVFDSSRSRGETLAFRLGEVIEGWNDGLQLMSPGDTFKLTIPPELGYGAQANGPIPANSTLIFEVELFSIVRPPAYQALNQSQAKTTPSGLKYQFLREGQGRLAKAEDVVELHLAYWTADGRLIDSTELNDNAILSPLSGMALPVLQEAPLLMNAGSRLLCEVSPELGFAKFPNGPVPADAVTVWQIELVRIVDIPAFVMPPPEELTTTDSGLQYKILEPGSGGSPKMYEWVTCNYAGWLTSGKLFDSSYLHGKPSAFMLGQVIPGWNEGLQLLKEGGKAIFVIPANLAYGKRATPTIPADSTLVFLVELVKLGKE